ncbi:MAG: DUF58 domain-containing protein [Leptonema sp. (in: bacteria)]
MKHLLLKFKHYFPFTSLGFLLFLTSLYLLGHSWGTGNLYAFLFSMLSFFLLFLILAIGFLLKFKNQSEIFFLDTSKSLYSRFHDQSLSVVFNFTLPIFFRVHYLLTGSFLVGRNAEFSCYFHSSFRPTDKQKTLEIPIYFPFCGKTNFMGWISIRDIFGLIKIPFRIEKNINLLILPPFFPEKSQLHILPASTQDHLRNVRSSDEEKYFMREYVPGDRLKDINWKSSMKIQELITRISPSSPEESHLIYIEIRPYHPNSKDGPQAILQLNYLKSWVLSFLRIMKKNHPNYKFQIFTGKETIFLEDELDIEAFAKNLAELPYLKESKIHEAPNTLERFVFSTGFDTQISHYLNYTRSKIFLFRVVYGSNKIVNLIDGISFSLIPKFWIMRKEKPDFSTPKPKQGKLIEEKLKLNYL